MKRARCHFFEGSRTKGNPLPHLVLVSSRVAIILLARVLLNVLLFFLIFTPAAYFPLIIISIYVTLSMLELARLGWKALF